MQRVLYGSMRIIAACALVATGAAGNAAEPGQEREAAIAAIEKLGGRVIKSSHNDRELVEVYLEGPKVTDDALKHLQHLPDLWRVRLFQTGVTDEGYAHLKGLKKLTVLKVTGELGDAAMKHIGGMTQLRGLCLENSTHVTDAGVKHIKGLTDLETLTLARSKVTDAGLEHLKGMTNLHHLDLYETQVGDAGVEHLLGLKELGHLELTRTKVTAAGGKRLKEALPKLGRRR